MLHLMIQASPHHFRQEPHNCCEQHSPTEAACSAVMLISQIKPPSQLSITGEQ